MCLDCGEILAPIGIVIVIGIGIGHVVKGVFYDFPRYLLGKKKVVEQPAQPAQLAELVLPAELAVEEPVRPPALRIKVPVSEDPC